MADSNDDLLEDGDLSETNFEELDLAEEDALLADADDDEKPIKCIHNEGDKTALEDDDYLELGVDEDLTLNDEEVIENGSSGKKKHMPIHIVDFTSNDNDDSDDNSGGERTRFKSERQISTSTMRNSTTIPETLDAVALRNPVKFIRGGNRGAKGGRGGGGNKKFGRNQPTNIHVNPHFRPRVPLGGPQMWNGGGFQGQPQHFQPPHHPPYGFQSQIQQPQWNDQGYFMQQPAPPAFHSPPMDNYYAPPQDNFYSHQPVQQNYPHQPPPQSQMGWGDPNYYPGGGPPQNYPPHFQQGPGPQMGPPRMRPPFNVGPRFPFNKNNQNKPFNVRHNQQGTQQQGWTGGVRPQKRDQFHNPGKVPPVKQQRFENTPPVHRPRSNLEEVKMVDSVPTDIAITEEEDEETKAYRKKIEEQKKLREQLLKEKEEKRLIAAQQKKLKETGRLGLKETLATPSTMSYPLSGDGPPGVTEEVNKVEYKMVRVRTADGKTVVKKMTLEEIKKLKKVTSAAITPKATPALNNTSGVPSCLVSVENLSASTTQKQLEDMAGQVGLIEMVQLDSETKTAIIKFVNLNSAKEFLTKYQRKMVDLSMIGVKFVQQE